MGVWLQFWEYFNLAFAEVKALTRMMISKLIGPPTEERLIRHVFEQGKFHDPESILKTIDEFGWKKHFLMNVGDVKGAILDSTVLNVLKNEPYDQDIGHIFIEMGGYIGYSALRIARNFHNKKATLYSIEMNPLFAAISTKIIEYAGLSDKVKVVVGTVENKLEWLTKQYGFEKVDMIFVDHWKDRYLDDIKLAEHLNILRYGTVVLADNVIFPGTPEYLKYVRNHAYFTSQLFESKLEYSNSIVDGLECSTYTKK